MWGNKKSKFIHDKDKEKKKKEKEKLVYSEKKRGQKNSNFKYWTKK